jgi:acyl-CoA hydrolase
VPTLIDLTRFIRPGDTVLVGQGTGEPRALVEALIDQRHALGGVTVFLGASFTGLFTAEHTDALRFVGLGGVGKSSALVKAGVMDVVPSHLAALPDLFHRGTPKIDVAFAQISTPDGNDEHSLGLVVDYIAAAVATARVTLAEVNANVPFSFGHTLVPASQFAAVVHDDRPLITVERREPTATDLAIAAHVDSLIPDGATLQVGVGGTPDAVIAILRNRRNLGIQTGLMTEALVDLIEGGAVTNTHKGIDHGSSVACSLFGTERLYRLAHRNPALLVKPVTYTHDASALAKVRSFHAINSAVEVDLTGQSNGELVDGSPVGTVGGHTTFARAAATAHDGRSIVMLASTAKQGTVSRIVARLPGGVVTTPRSDADVVVTEHGVAHLRGATESQRIQRMIAIADPRFRDDLQREVHRGFSGPTTKVPS